ncbi:MAG: hypothetical protein ABJA80_11030 [bacterium]
MDSASVTRPLAIEEDDLLVVAQAITMRCTLQTAEAMRAARLRALALVAAHLGRTLSTYARHALVNCQGTPGASDVDADTRLLAAALRDFCSEIENVSGTYAGALPPLAPQAPAGRHLSTAAPEASASPRRRAPREPMTQSLPH